MKKITMLCAVGFVALFFGCGNNEHNNQLNSLANQGVSQGGILRVNEIDNFKTLMPIAINDITSYHLASQVYEGLVKYNQSDLSVVPALARSWEVSPDLKEYTFHLRSNAKFSNDPCFRDSIGRRVFASDVRYCFENLCSKNINNSQYHVTFKDRVEGADDFYAESSSGKVRTFTGMTVVDDSTLRIRLIRPDANFLNILTMPGCYIYPKEADVRYGKDMRIHTVGTGPFFHRNFKRGRGGCYEKKSKLLGHR